MDGSQIFCEVGIKSRRLRWKHRRQSVARGLADRGVNGHWAVRSLCSGVTGVTADDRIKRVEHCDVDNRHCPTGPPGSQLFTENAVLARGNRSMIQTAGINCYHVPTVKRIEPPPWASGMWNAGRRVKQRTEQVVESVIRAEGEGQNRQNEASEQERFFHVTISGAVFYTDIISAWPEQIFLFERSIFDDEHLTFRRTMRAEPFQIQNFIDGQFVEPVSGKYLDNIEPATGKPYSQVADSDARDVELAVAAAEKAFRDWSQKPAADRSRFLLRIADLIERDLEKFARAESIDTGKPISLARTLDIPRAVANFRFFATAILHTESEAHITDNVAFNYTLRQPRGIAGLISPWNLPLYLLSWKIAPAIAVGNTAIAKPSELTPMTAYLLCEIAREAGLPNGVLNIVHGTGPNVGAAITAHPKINTISFTGRHRHGTQSRRSVRAVVQESVARARRKKSEHHFRRCRSRRRHRRQCALLLRESGTGLPVRLARLCRAIGLRRFCRALRR